MVQGRCLAGCRCCPAEKRHRKGCGVGPATHTTGSDECNFGTGVVGYRIASVVLDMSGSLGESEGRICAGEGGVHPCCDSEQGGLVYIVQRCSRGIGDRAPRGCLVTVAVKMSRKAVMGKADKRSRAHGPPAFPLASRCCHVVQSHVNASLSQPQQCENARGFSEADP